MCVRVRVRVRVRVYVYFNEENNSEWHIYR